MRVEEMALRSEIRQMLNEVGFNRETIKEMVRNSIDDIDDIVKNQVNQVLMERKEKDLGEVVSDYIESKLYTQIRNTSESVIRDKLRWMKFNVNVNVQTEEESEDKK